MTDTTSSAAAPGWYPDGSGGQRWWDGRGWTEHTAPAVGVAQPLERPQLPAGTRVDTVWVWLVALLTLVSGIPIFFFDMTGYMRAILEAQYTNSPAAISGALTGYLAFFAIVAVIGWGAFAVLVFSAYRDYKHLLSVGVERPFHWAFAFIPYPIVYLIGRHVVLRKVTRTAGWPLWAHIASYVVLFIASFVWMIVVIQAVFSDLSGYMGYANFS